LADAFFNDGGVVVVEGEVLIHGLVQDEAAAALADFGQGVERIDLLARGGEGDLLLLHVERILDCVCREVTSSISFMD
jgi:hypothetical protein